MPRSDARQVLDRERIDVHDRLTGLDSREVEQVVDERKQRLGAVADVDDLTLLLLGQRSVGASEQQVAESQHRAQWRSQLVAHARQESRLGLAVAPQLLGTLVELGVQRHHTAVGFLELAVEARELLSARGQLLECAHQLLVLKLQFTGRIIDLGEGERIGDFAELGRSRRRLHEPFGDRDHGPAPGLRRDLETVHQPARADDPQAHAGGRLVAAVEDVVEICDPWSLVADLDQELGLVHRVDRVGRPPAARVLKRVACELGHCSGHSGLVLRIESQQRRDLASALARDDDVLLALDRHGRNRPRHARATTAVASSRPRW